MGDDADAQYEADREQFVADLVAASGRFVIAQTFPASGFLFDHDDD